MALKFNQSKGSAQKNSIESVKYVDGENRIRIVGDILPRYVYWLKGENNKNVPVECLAFNRDEERFDQGEKDWVREYYPDMNCVWGYCTQGIVGDKIMVVNLKKKLWEQVITAAEDLGDPTDPETGWDIVFEKKKTGPHVFNVEYQLKVLRCKPRPLSEEEMELVKELKSMDEVMPRPTPDQQKEFLDRIRTNETASKEVDEDAIEKEFDVSS